LHSVLDPDRIEATLEHLSASGQSPLAEDSRRHAITALIDEAEQRLTQFKAALARGADPGVVSTWINEAQADLAKARTDLALLNNEVPAEFSRSDLTTVVTDMSALVRGLSTATPATKADLYRDLGLRLIYHDGSGEVDAEVSTAQACAKRGVRGGTWAPRGGSRPTSGRPGGGGARCARLRGHHRNVARRSDNAVILMRRWKANTPGR
jgi:site-specific DNA recombinase